MLGASVNKALEEQEIQKALMKQKEKEKDRKKIKKPIQSSDDSNNMMPIDTIPGDTINETNQNNISYNNNYIKNNPKTAIPDKIKNKKHSIHKNEEDLSFNSSKNNINNYPIQENIIINKKK